MGNIRYITRVVMHGSFVLHGEEETSVLLFFESFGSFAMCMYVCIYVYIYWRRGRGILAHEEYNNNNPWKGIVRIARGRDAQRKAGGHQGNGTCTRPDTRYQMLTSRENHGRRHASVYTRKTLSLATEHGMFR